MLKGLIVGLTLGLTASAVAQMLRPAVNTQLEYTIATLPTCNAAARGLRVHVTDALTPVALAVVVAGGAAVVPVFCNGVGYIIL